MSAEAAATLSMSKLHENHHLWSKLRIGQWAMNGQAKVLYESGLIEPDPFPKGYQ